MTDKEKLELMMILSRFEGFLWGHKVHDDYINEQLDRAIELLADNKERE